MIMPWDKLSKVDAIRAIFAAFYKSAEYQATPTDEVDAAIRMYLAMFDQHDSSHQVSAEQGARYVRGSESDHEDEDPARKDGPERLRTESPIPQGSSAKKCALDESPFPWLVYKLTNNTFLIPVVNIPIYSFSPLLFIVSITFLISFRLLLFKLCYLEAMDIFLHFSH